MAENEEKKEAIVTGLIELLVSGISAKFGPEMEGRTVFLDAKDAFDAILGKPDRALQSIGTQLMESGSPALQSLITALISSRTSGVK